MYCLVLCSGLLACIALSPQQDLHAKIATGFDRFSFVFTIKDSPDYLMNVSLWGNDEYINGLSNTFSVGDCSEIIHSIQLYRYEDRL